MSMPGMAEFLYFRLVSGLLSLVESVFSITSFIGVIETKQPATAVIVGQLADKVQRLDLKAQVFQETGFFREKI